MSYIGKKIGKPILILVQLVMVVLFAFPFYLLIINSFKDFMGIYRDPLAWPENLTWSKISDMISSGGATKTFSFFEEDIEQSIFANIGTAFRDMDFEPTFFNSVWITVASVVLILLFSAMAAHFMVRNDNKFNRILFYLLVFSMTIPFQVVMIPINVVYGGTFGMFEHIPMTTLIMLYIGFGSSLAVVIYHGFVKSIPYELEEAAQMDGCSRIGVFFRIVLPIMLPTSVTIAILTVLWIWNDYLLPSIILTKPELFTMPIQMKQFNGEYQNEWTLLIPAMLLTIFPMIIAYLFGQKYIIRGVMQGAIK